jgi:hypothetical protein
VETVQQWTGQSPWISVSYDATGYMPISVGEIWVVYTREGHYAIMEITEVTDWSNFTFDYKYQPNGSTDFTGQPPGDTTPPTAVDDLAVDDFPALGELILDWSATGDDGTEGTAISYEIRYSTSLDSLENQFDSVALVENLPTPSAPGTRDTVHVTDLASRTTYYFAMKVVDDEGNKSALSNIIAVVTPGLIVTENYIPTYWSASEHGIVYVRHSIVITDSITIEAGVQVDCAVGEEITVHPGGRIVAIGTLNNPIYWRGYGRWRGIVFTGSADNCVFEHVIVDSIEVGYPAFRFVSGRPVIRNSRLNAHIVCDSIQQANPTVEGCTFVSRVGYLYYPIYGGPMTQIIDCDFSGWQGYYGIRIYGGAITRAITWYYYPDFPYYISGNIRVSGNVWTVRPNARIFFTASDTLIVESGGLIFGDDAAPGDSVYLSCTCPQGGYWGGIVINSAVTTVNLRYVVIRKARNIYYDGGVPRYFAIRFHNAGYDTTKIIAYSTIYVDVDVYPILLVNSSPRLIYNRFYGTIYSTDYRSNPIIRYCNFFGAGTYPIYAGPMVIIQGCDFANWTCTSRCGFWIYGGEITRRVTWHYNVGYPYWVRGNIYVYDGEWFIQPKVRVYYDVDVEVIVGTEGRPGRLITEATTEADSIVFACDPDTLTKYWGGIQITQYVTEIQLKYIVVRRARGIYNDDGVDRYFGICFHDMADTTQFIQYSRIDTIVTDVIGVYGYPILLINSSPKLIQNRYYGRIYATNGSSNPIIWGGWWYGTGYYPIYVGPRTIYRGTLYFNGWANARAFWVWGGTINVDVIWRPVNVVGYTYLPYYFVDDVTICCNARLRLRPGVRSRWRNGKILRVGDLDGNTIGKLICQGTITDSIYFETDIEDTTKRWGGIVVTSKADTVKIEYAVIRYAKGIYDDNGTERRFGICFHDAEVDTLTKIVRYCRIIVDPAVERYYPVLLINSSPLLAYNTYHGSLYCTDGTSNPLIRGGRWIGSIGYPIYTGAMTIFDCSCHDFTRWTGRRQIWFWGTTITRNTHWRYIPGLPYYCHGDVIVDGDVTLTIIKKVYVYYNVNKILRIRNSGRLHCVGGSNPDSTEFIALKCANPDSFWGGLRFDETAGKSRVSRTLLRRGGSIKEDDEDHGAAVTTASEDSLELDHLVVAKSKGHGVRFKKKNPRARLHSSIISEVGEDNPDSLETVPVVTEADDDSTMVDHNLVVDNPNNDIENLKGKKGGCTNNELPNTLPFLVEGDSTYRIAPNSIVRNTGIEGSSAGLYDYEDTQEPSEVESPRAIRRGNGSARIRFDSAGDDSTFGRAKHTDVKWSTDDITEENWDELTEGTTITTPEHASDCAVDEIVVPGLNKDKKQKFGFRARDEAGNRSGLIVVEAEHQLAITPDSLWFGGVAVGTTDTIQVTLANIGEDTLNITGVRFGSSGAYSVSDTNFTILPDEEAYAKVYFMPTADDSFPDTMSVYYGEDYNPVPILGIGTPRVVLSEDNYAHWQMNDGATPNNAIAQISKLNPGDTYAYQARLYKTAGQYASYTYADGWKSPEDAEQATFVAAAPDTNLSIYYKSNGDMIPDEEIGEDWYLSVNIKNISKDVWSPNLNLPIQVGSSTTADTLYDMGWIEGFLEDSTSVSGRAPVSAAKVTLRRSPPNGLYETEINNIDEGYPDTDGYFRIAIPAGHQMEELEFRYPDNSLMAVVNVSEDDKFKISAGDTVDVGTYYFGGDLLIQDGYFEPGTSDSLFVEIMNTSLPFSSVIMQLSFDSDILDITDVSVASQYDGILGINSTISDSIIDVTVNNTGNAILTGEIIKLNVSVDPDAPMNESTVIAFEKGEATTPSNVMMLGTGDGDYCIVEDQNLAGVSVDRDTIEVSLLIGETTTETLIITGSGGIPAEFLLDATDVNWFSYSPESDTLSGCESLELSLTFDATQNTPGVYELDLIIHGENFSPDETVYIKLTINNLQVDHPDILSVQKLIMKIYVQQYDSAYDEDGDGDLDTDDLKLMIKRWGE